MTKRKIIPELVSPTPKTRPQQPQKIVKRVQNDTSKLTNGIAPSVTTTTTTTTTPSTPTKKSPKKRRRPKFTRYVAWMDANHLNKDTIEAFEEMEKQQLAADLGKERLTFGKYKGEKYIDLWTGNSKKKSYLRWMANQKDMFDDVKTILTLLKERYPS